MHDEVVREPSPPAAPDDIVLPNRKEVNTLISEEARRDRERARGARQRGSRQWVTLAEDAERKRPNDVFRQFAYCVRVGKIPAGTGRARNVGSATQTKFGTDCKLALNELRSERANVRNLSELNGGKVVLLVKRWLRQGKSPSTINGRVAALRKLLVLLGKPGAVPTGAAWKRLLRANGIEPEALKRPQIRVKPKSVSAQGLRPEEVIDRIDPRHLHERLWLRLQWHFGLRPRECSMLDPHESDRGDHLLVLRGAKGNRQRMVKLSVNPERRAAQRELLEDAKVLALGHPQWRLHSRERNTEQALNHFYHVVRKSGLTEAELGVMPYSFRHEFANTEYEEISGLPAPVLRKVHPSEYAVRADLVQAAECHVVRQLGHSAQDKSNSYNGSVHEEGRRLKRQHALLAIVGTNEPLAKAVERAGIQEAWLVGKAATGDKLDSGEPIELALRVSKGLSTIAMLELGSALQTLPHSVALTWCSERPEPGLEVLFSHQRSPRLP